MFYVLVYGPMVASLLLAGFAAGLARRSSRSLSTPVRILTAIAMLLALGATIAQWLWSIAPTWVPHFSGPDADLMLPLARYLSPLATCAVAVVIMVFPLPTAGPRGSAALTPRNLLTYTRAKWLWSLGGLLALVVVVTVLAGLLSTTDDLGRHVMYEVLASKTTSASTQIYGWWFSVRALSAVAALVLLMLVGLAAISRPAVGFDPDADALIRRVRSRNLVVVTAGGVLLHFSVVLNSLAGTSSLGLGFDSGSAGWVSLGTSFAALEPVLRTAGIIALVAGLTAWWFVLFSILPRRTRRHTAVATS